MVFFVFFSRFLKLSGVFFLGCDGFSRLRACFSER